MCLQDRKNQGPPMHSAVQPSVPDQVIPVIDVGPFIRGEGGAAAVVEAIEFACRDIGFFLVTGHGVSQAKTRRLYDLARAFFDLEEDYKRSQGRGTDVLGGVAFSPLADEALAATQGIKTPGDYQGKPELRRSPARQRLARRGRMAWKRRFATISPRWKRSPAICAASSAAPSGCNPTISSRPSRTISRRCASSTIPSRRWRRCPASFAPASTPTTAS